MATEISTSRASPGEGEPEPRDHIYLQNMTVERGGNAVFQRPKGEVWRAGQMAEHCP